MPSSRQRKQRQLRTKKKARNPVATIEPFVGGIDVSKNESKQKVFFQEVKRPSVETSKQREERLVQLRVNYKTRMEGLVSDRTGESTREAFRVSSERNNALKQQIIQIFDGMGITDPTLQQVVLRRMKTQQCTTVEETLKLIQEVLSTQDLQPQTVQSNPSIVPVYNHFKVPQVVAL
jgi:hypothetical protein